jgi:hypothetical protein
MRFSLSSWDLSTLILIFRTTPRPLSKLPKWILKCQMTTCSPLVGIPWEVKIQIVKNRKESLANGSVTKHLAVVMCAEFDNNQEFLY